MVISLKLSHLRESRTIEQDADIVALLHRDRELQQTTDQSEIERNGLESELIIAKHRNEKLESSSFYLCRLTHSMSTKVESQKMMFRIFSKEGYEENFICSFHFILLLFTSLIQAYEISKIQFVDDKLNPIPATMFINQIDTKPGSQFLKEVK